MIPKLQNFQLESYTATNLHWNAGACGKYRSQCVRTLILILNCITKYSFRVNLFVFVEGSTCWVGTTTYTPPKMDTN